MSELPQGSKGVLQEIPDRYYDNDIDKHIVKVLAGDVETSHSEEDVLATVLGSCIAVCLYDSVQKIGGMNHFILPDSSLEDSGSTDRYGAFSIETLINALMKQGAQRSCLEAKLFGGANVTSQRVKIGDHNIDFARQFLAKEGIPIVSEDVAGTTPRRIHFYPTSGKVMVRKLVEEPVRSLIQGIEQHLESLTTSTISHHDDHNIELF